MRPEWRFVLADAERIQKSAHGKYTYSKDDYGRAMLDLATSEKRDDESTAAALSRLWGLRDHRIETLYKASQGAPLIGRTPAQEVAALLLEDFVKSHQRAGETFERCYDRLARTDAAFRRMYDLYSQVRA